MWRIETTESKIVETGESKIFSVYILIAKAYGTWERNMQSNWKTSIYYNYLTSLFLVISTNI